MSIDYDPYSNAAMSDPHPIYKELRAEGCPHFVASRRAWALTRYDHLRTASLHNEWLDFTAGQTPSQLMLGEPSPHTFMTMNAPENRKWRGLLEPFYSAASVAQELPRITRLIEDEFAALRGCDSFDVYHDFANKVMCLNAGHNLGLDHEQAVQARALIDRMILNRVPDQVGASSDDSKQAAAELGGILHQHVARMRADPAAGGPHGRLLRDAEVDGVRLSDEDLLYYLFSLLVVGSETTPMAVAGTLYYLAANPEQKAQVLADPALLPAAFRETCRFDQPTNMLARRAAMDFELGGSQISKGDNLLFIYASANRDENRFADPDRYDLARENKGDMSFGVGAHFCLGAILAQAAGRIMLETICKAIDDYQVVEEECERAFGEHLNGFVRMVIRPRWKA
ncbi:MAG: cytochrome P450 [Erythrobacter sp.]|nr:cytochrome P450 [Erythrobacter sp.]